MASETLSSTTNTGITLTASGADIAPFTVTAAGTINTGNSEGIYSQLAAPFLLNQGAIIATGAIYAGILLTDGGTIVNSAHAVIQGELDGVVVDAAAATVSNAGTITAGKVDGVLLFDGGTVINTGTIGGPGAVKIEGAGDARVVAGNGAVFIGTVAASDSGNTLEFAGSGGTVASIGTQFTDFQTIAFDTGSAWTISGGASALAALATITGVTSSDVIDVTGFAAASASYTAGVGLVLTSAASSYLLHLGGNETFGITGDGRGGTDIIGTTQTLASSLAAGITLTANGAFRAPFTITPTGTIKTGGTAGIFSTLAAPFVLNEGSVIDSGTGHATGILLADGGTVINAGTIEGSLAVSLGGAGNSRLVAETGAVFIGTLAAAGTGNTLELGGTGSIASPFTGFQTLAFDPGAAWTVSGDVAEFATLETITGVTLGDVIDITGATIGSANYTTGIGLVLTSGGNDYVLNADWKAGLSLSSDGNGGTDIAFVQTHTQTGATPTGITLTATGLFLSPFTVTQTGTVASSGYGIYSTLAASYLLNQGSISSAAARAVRFEDGGTVVNAGTIAGGVDISGGNARVVAQANDLFYGAAVAGAAFLGTVAAAGSGNIVELQGSGGSVASIGTQFTGFETVAFDSGAVWTIGGDAANLMGLSTIAGFGYGDEIDLTGFAATTASYTAGVGLELSNATASALLHVSVAAPFTIVSDGNGGTDFALVPTHVLSTLETGGITLSPGPLASPFTITQSGTIKSGVNDGVISNLVAPALLNAGTIISSGSAGVLFNHGGTVTNSGTITGGADGVELTNRGTVINSGTIAGAVAVYIQGGGSRVVYEAGAKFIGGVKAMGSYNTLELSGSSGNATLTGLGSTFYGFRELDIESGANWTLSGNNIVDNYDLIRDAGNLTNTGQINVVLSGRVYVTSGQTLTNTGGINVMYQTGLYLYGSDLVTNSGTIHGANGGISGAGHGVDTVINSGTISGQFTDGLLIAYGLTLTNTAAGNIFGFTNGVNVRGNFFNGYYAGTISNAGVITGGNGNGVYLATGGLVTNAQGGDIAGSTNGVQISGIQGFIGGTVVNAGNITGGTGDGVALGRGGAVTNSASGVISGGSDGVDNGQVWIRVTNAGTITGANIGVKLVDQSTLYNSGTIAGGAAAVLIGGSGDARVVAETGAVFIGDVEVSGTGNRLDLAGTGNTVVNIGGQFIGFQTVAFDPDAVWTISGDAAALAGLASISGFNLGDEIDLTGFAAASASLTAGVGLVLSHGTSAELLHLGLQSDYTLTSDGHGGTEILAVPASAEDVLYGTNTTGITLTTGGPDISPFTVTQYASIDTQNADGVYSTLAAPFLFNAGSISDTGTSGSAGVLLTHGGTVINAGTIAGPAAIDVQGAGDARVVAQGGTAFYGTAGDGAVFIGAVEAAGSGNTLEFAGVGGSVASIGGQFTGFQTIQFDPGALWTISGDAAVLTALSTITGMAAGDVIDLTGLAASSANYTTGIGLVLTGEAGTQVLHLDSTGAFSVSSDGNGGTDLVIVPTHTLSSTNTTGITLSNTGLDLSPFTITSTGTIDTANAEGIYSAVPIATVLNQGNIIATGSSATVGVLLTDTGTIINSGTIAGSLAVDIGGTGGSRVVGENGGAFIGRVEASGEYENTLEFAGTGGAPLSFSGFAVIIADGGANWTLGGTSSFNSSDLLYDLGSLTNAGTLISTGSRGITVGGDGILANTGTIIGEATYGVQLRGGAGLVNNGFLTGVEDGAAGFNAVPNLINTGTIIGGSADGVYTQLGGYVANDAAAVITGGENGVEARGFAGDAFITNAGTIRGASGDGVYLGAGGAVYNNGTAGIIAGGKTGVEDSSAWIRVNNAGTISGGTSYGLYLIDQSTIFNSGTIAGGGAAIRFGGAGDAVVVAETGAMFIGDVQAAGSGNVLELAGTGSTVASIGGQFTGFQTVAFDPGAAWTISGDAAELDGLAAITGVTLGDVIDLSGFAATAASYTAGIGLVLTSAATSYLLSISGGGFFSIAGDGDGGTDIIFGTHTLAATISSGISLTANGPDLSRFTVTPTGRIASAGYGIYSTLSGAYLLNQGSIASSGGDAVRFENGSTLTNDASGVIAGGGNGVDARGYGIIANYGAISGVSANAIYVANNGYINNSGAGAILSGGVDGVDIGGYGVLFNTGTLTGGSANGVYLARGGYFYNIAAAAIIAGRVDGVDDKGNYGSNGFIVNEGTINGATGDGIYLGGGGAVTNTGSGVISGGEAGVDDSKAWIRVTNAGTITGGASYGLYLIDQSTIFNSGTIAGGVAAIDIAGTGDAAVVLETGAAFIGKVEAAGADNTLALAGTGTFTGLGTSFIGFSQIAVDSGANWVLDGANTIAAGTALSNAGGLTLSNTALTGLTNLANNGTITLDPSTLTVAGNLTGKGVVTLGAGSTLEVTGGIASKQNIILAGAGAKLQITDTADIAGTLRGAGTIDITDLPFASFASASFNSVSDLLGITFASGTLALHGDFAGDILSEKSDGSGGTELVESALCYLHGTRILTPTGQVAVEDLRVGDAVVTRFGGIQRIKWLGRQHYAPAFIGNNPGKWPVCIKAGALAEGVPARDLYVSPGHSMLLDGVLVLASTLVNGATVTQSRPERGAKYVQLDLGSHDCVIAEGAWSETYADAPGMRAQFHNAAEYDTLYPDEPPVERLSLCAPRPERGARLAAALAPVVARAAVEKLGKRLL